MKHIIGWILLGIILIPTFFFLAKIYYEEQILHIFFLFLGGIALLVLALFLITT